MGRVVLSRSVAESPQLSAGRVGLVSLRQLHTKRVSLMYVSDDVAVSLFGIRWSVNGLLVN